MYVNSKFLIDLILLVAGSDLLFIICVRAKWSTTESKSNLFLTDEKNLQY